MMIDPEKASAFMRERLASNVDAILSFTPQISSSTGLDYAAY
jgi:hypothetical protein